MRKKSWLLWAMALVFGFAVMSGGCGGGGGGENGGDEPVSDPQAAKLSGLVLSAGVLSPSFSPDTMSYTANVANDAAFVTVKPTAPHPAGETVTVNYVAVNSGSVSEPIFLDIGENVISVIVTANDDPGNTRTYTVAVTREEAGGSATTGNWIDDGVADTSWYSPYDASRTVYEISTAAQLGGLAKLVNNFYDAVDFDGKTIKLTNDIDLAGRGWTPVGDDIRDFFSGMFDGGGYTISNMKINIEHAIFIGYDGLFGYLGYDATVKNVHLTNIDVTSFSDESSYAGGIVGYNLGTVTDCAAGGTVTVYSNANDYNKSSVAGGIAGYSSYVGIVTNCAASVSVTAYSPWAASSCAGGIVGVNYGTTAPHRGMVANCAASGSVMASASAASYFYAGGVIGRNDANTTVTGNTYSKVATGQEYGIGYDERLNPPGPSDDGAAPR